jgi:hypothetical protein
VIVRERRFKINRLALHLFGGNSGVSAAVYRLSKKKKPAGNADWLLFV